MKHVLALLVVVGSLGLVGCGGGAGPGDTVKELAHAMEKGDVETVKKIAPAMQAILGSDKLGQMVAEAAKGMKEEGGIKAITIDEETIDGDSATVKATIEKGNGEKDTEDFKLEKVNGQWVITLDEGNKEGGAPPDIDLRAPEFNFDAPGGSTAPEVPEIPGADSGQ